MSLTQIDRAKEYGNRIKALKYLLSTQKFDNKDIGDPQAFPDANQILKIIRTGSESRQRWEMVEEANRSFNIGGSIRF